MEGSLPLSSAGSDDPASGSDPVLVDLSQMDPLRARQAHPALDAVVIAGVLEHLSKAEGRQRLAAYRNALYGGILVFIDLSMAKDWSDTDFIGLGFRRAATFPHPEHPISAYAYNLRQYNHKRLWNTPQYWANPENFGKYWW